MIDFYQYITPLAGERLRPLGHLSERRFTLNLRGLASSFRDTSKHYKSERFVNRTVQWGDFGAIRSPAVLNFSNRPVPSPLSVTGGAL